MVPIVWMVVYILWVYMQIYLKVDQIDDSILNLFLLSNSILKYIYFLKKLYLNVLMV